MEEEKKIQTKDKAIIAVLLLLLAVGVGIAIVFANRGGKENPEPKSKDLFGYFDTYANFTVYSGISDKEFVEVSAAVEERLDYYHRLFDIYHVYNGITNAKNLNDNAGEGALEISRELFDFLVYSKEICELTGGEVNIAMGAVLSIWHEYREEGKAIPEMQALESAALHTDINSLVLNEEKLTAEIKDPQLSLDLGALAKGYAVERIASDIEKMGYTSFVLNVGGNLRAVGAKPDGAEWETGVKNPDPTAENKYSYRFKLSDSSAVTSGNYERYYTVGGVNYHHIIDKDTLMPAAHFASVTVVTKSSALADALSTALFNMTYEEGVYLLEGLEGVFVVWVANDGSVTTYE